MSLVSYSTQSLSKNVSRYRLNTQTDRSFATDLQSNSEEEDFIGNSVFRNQKKSKIKNINESSILLQSSKILEQDSSILHLDHIGSRKKNRVEHNKFVT